MPHAAMLPSHNRRARKQPTNLSLDGDLLRQARELGINLSASLEGALEDLIRRRMGEPVGDLSRHRHDIISALHFLITGF